MRRHWREYVIEACGLGLFMVSASSFGVLVFHAASPVAQALASAHVLQRLVMGMAMAFTAAALIYSPWGKRSGAHFNPATTLTFWRLGRVEGRDAAAYVLAQLGGGVLGMFVAAALLGQALGHASVGYVTTRPGALGAGAAFVAEVAIAFLLMLTVLWVSNTRRLSRYTGLFAAGLVCTYITLEAPISGMSLNPARSFSSALVGWLWPAFWVYVIAPPLGMLLAAEVYTRVRGAAAVHCAKLHHDNDQPCIFRCRFGELAGQG
jgi:aquaporin Z